MIMKCNLCGYKCNVDRKKQSGVCGVKTLRIAKYGVYFNEEPCISGTNGSGTIFFCSCSLKCVFCQNYPVSRNQIGREISIDKLIEIMKELVNKGVHNINFVNPTHYTYEILAALEKYTPPVPLVWNTHGYDSEETIELIKDKVKIFLIDFKYYDNGLAKKYSKVPHYFETASLAIKKMREVVDDNFIDNIMQSGLIIRHLILPSYYKDSMKICKWISDNMRDTIISIMSQFTPYGKVKDYPEINRKLFSAENKKVIDYCQELDLKGYFQPSGACGEKYIPKWDY